VSFEVVKKIVPDSLDINKIPAPDFMHLGNILTLGEALLFSK